MQVRDIDVSLKVDEAVGLVREANRRRLQNNRDTISQTLTAGRVLYEEIKPTIQFGQWERWLQANAVDMGYDITNPVRSAQLDMQFWRTWKPYVQELSANNVINNVIDSEIVNGMTQHQVNVSISALYAFMGNAVPDNAIRMAIDTLAKTGELTTTQAKTIIDASKAIYALPEKVQEFAIELYESYGLTNPDVIENLPSLLENNDIASQMLETGYLTIPVSSDGDERSVKIDRISSTDVLLVLQNEEVETALRKLTHIKDSLQQREEDRRKLTFLATVKGTRQELVEQILNLDDRLLYHITVYTIK